ncbi:CubicO group peptidase (beta-lactamase class C family) [Flavobacterium chryseum]|uniref:serine hydrolase domain-containing protein n=1 Tax=Flavobacterium sp. P3160 TaxID=2512113 RepID=UPI00105DFF7F|nr:serine hydrolase [Flavobacterium sp. P3160]TDO73325.1 CubicO group peptidase (beta-lactamase class C family) [Flavobacterium sp. P3160]
MKKEYLLLLFLLSAYFGHTQQKNKITYEQLKEYEGSYEYTNKTTLKIAASPKDTLLYAIINESKYPLKPTEKDVFQNMSKENVTFLRNNTGAITGYSSEGNTFNLLNKKVVFPKEMWYPRLNVTKDFKYVYVPPKKDPLDGLATGTLDNSGLDKALLNEMMQKIVNGSYPNVHSVLIIKDGKLVFEEYFYEYNKTKLHELRSATKSFVSALAGIAIDKGLIKSKDETVLSYFKDYTFKHLSDDKREITIEDLLSNESGLDCDVSNPKTEGNETAMNNSADWIQYTLDLPMIAIPGGNGMYCSGNPIVMGKIIERATKMTLPDFAKQTLFKDLGITNFKWNFKPDASSAETFCQLYLNSRDMAKLGLLYLNKGTWNGKQVISKNWVQESFTKHSVVQGVNYGYLWWLKYLEVNGVRFEGKVAQGNGGQKIYVWEDQNMITVITGGNYNSQSSSDELIQKYILPAFKN